MIALKKVAIIFAGGAGHRMGAEIPKQFLKVSGKEIIIHTLELFENHTMVDEIVVICIESWISYLQNLVNKFGIDKVVSIVPGGKTGQDSIFIGLQETKKRHENAIVLIHDGVRPLVTEETITKCVVSAEEFGTAITATGSYETPLISLNGDKVDDMPDRKVVYTAQAPQCFYLNELYDLHLKEREVNPDYEGIVDSCGLMFKYGKRCHLIEGNRGNVKVTSPVDFCTLIGNLNAKDYAEFLSLGNSSASESKKK